MAFWRWLPSRTLERSRGKPLTAPAVAAAFGVAVLTVAVHGAVRSPKLDYTAKTLPNGLQVVVLEDHSTPIVSVQVWYHVGSKDEPAGQTGFAHLFEHLMFKGSKNVAPEQHSSLIARVGGQSNAYTTEDVSVFWNTLPSRQLPLALWLEADRMATLRIDREAFDLEREIVKEERRMRVENQPYGRLPEIVYEHAFTTHPYRHPTIGLMKDLEAASVRDVRTFFRNYFVPQNATLVVAGDVGAAQVFELAARYFGRIPMSARVVRRSIPTEPPAAQPRRATREEKWPLPVVVLAHHVPAEGHPDAAALRVAAKILADGQSARLFRRLVYEDGLAFSAYGAGNFAEHPGVFYVVAVVQPGHTPEEAESALAAELDRLRTEPVSDDDLSKARKQFARDVALGRATVHQKAEALARAATLHGDASQADAQFERAQAVTAADIQRVARLYFEPVTRLAITVRPQPVKTEAKK